jgi:AraC-like DNA-binding protein
METPHLNLPAILNLLGAVQALLLALALVTIRRGNRTANLLLAGFAANIAILITGLLLITTHYIQVFPHLSRLHHPFDFTLAPLLYLYVREMTNERAGLKRRDALHFIPFALCLVYLIPYYLQSGEAKLYNLNSVYYARWYFVRSGLAILLALVYLVCIVARVIAHSREVKAKQEPVARFVLFQIRFLVGAIAAVWVLAAARYVIDMLLPAYMFYTNLILPFSATLVVYAMAYISLMRPEAVTGAAEFSDEAQPFKKYEKSSLTVERSERYLKRLLEVLEKEKPYLDAELNIQKLAERLQIPAPHLSQTINERLRQNFSDLINSYRVEEAKRRLLDPAKKHYSILAIAEEVGFNSKSSFNSVFKKHANATPSEWRKAMNGHAPNGSQSNGSSRS